MSRQSESAAVKRSDSTATREQILHAARAIARERGYKGTTLAMIQKAAGVHPGSFYWFFKDKDTMFAALVEHAYAEATAPMDDLAVTEHPNPVGAALSRIVDNPARLGLWRFNVQLMLDPDMHQSKTAEAIRRLRVLTQESMVRQWLRGLDPEVVTKFPQLAQQLAEYALAIVEGCVLARVAGKPLDEEFVTQLATSVMDELVAKACRQAGVGVPEGIDERLTGKEPHHGLAG